MHICVQSSLILVMFLTFVSCQQTRPSVAAEENDVENASNGSIPIEISGHEDEVPASEYYLYEQQLGAAELEGTFDVEEEAGALQLKFDLVSAPFSPRCAALQIDPNDGSESVIKRAFLSTSGQCVLTGLPQALSLILRYQTSVDSMTDLIIPATTENERVIAAKASLVKDFQTQVFRAKIKAFIAANDGNTDIAIRSTFMLDSTDVLMTVNALDTVAGADLEGVIDAYGAAIAAGSTSEMRHLMSRGESKGIDSKDIRLFKHHLAKNYHAAILQLENDGNGDSEVKRAVKIAEMRMKFGTLHDRLAVETFSFSIDELAQKEILVEKAKRLRLAKLASQVLDKIEGRATKRVFKQMDRIRKAKRLLRALKESDNEKDRERSEKLMKSLENMQERIENASDFAMITRIDDQKLIETLVMKSNVEVFSQTSRELDLEKLTETLVKIFSDVDDDEDRREEITKFKKEYLDQFSAEKTANIMSIVIEMARIKMQMAEASDDDDGDDFRTMLGEVKTTSIATIEAEQMMLFEKAEGCLSDDALKSLNESLKCPYGSELEKDENDCPMPHCRQPEDVDCPDLSEFDEDKCTEGVSERYVNGCKEKYCTEKVYVMTTTSESSATTESTAITTTSTSSADTTASESTKTEEQEKCSEVIKCEDDKYSVGYAFVEGCVEHICLSVSESTEKLRNNPIYDLMGDSKECPTLASDKEYLCYGLPIDLVNDIGLYRYSGMTNAGKCEMKGCRAGIGGRCNRHHELSTDILGSDCRKDLICAPNEKNPEGVYGFCSKP